MPVEGKIRSGAKWLLMGNVGNQILQFGFGIILARLLLPSEFGMMAAVGAFTAIAGLVATGGMGQALVRAKTASAHDFDIVFTFQVTIGILIFGGFYIAAPFIADFFEDPIYSDLVRVSAVSFLIRPLQNMRRSWLHREMQFKHRSIIDIIDMLTASVFSIAMAYAGMGVWSLIFSGILSSLLTVILLAFVVPQVSPRLTLDFSGAESLSAYGAKVTLSGVVMHINQKGMMLIINKMTGPGPLGLFNKAFSLGQLPVLSIGGAVYQPVFRAMAADQDNADKVKYLYLRMMTLLALYTLPLYLVLALLAEPLIVFLFGPNWVDAAAPLTILAPLGLVYCINHPAGAVLAACNGLGIQLVIRIVNSFIMLLGTYLALTWDTGISGIAWVFVIGQIYSTIHMFIGARNFIDVTPLDVLKAIKPGLGISLLPAVALGLYVYFVPVDLIADSVFLYLLIAGAILAATYLVGILSSRAEVIKEETARIRGFLQR